jgi:hypothetical protein
MSMLARSNPLRTLTWRRLLRTTANGFLEWVESTESRFQAFDQLAAALETLLLDHVLTGNVEISATEACTQFAKALPLALSKCDEPIYDAPFVAEAYAFLHLLERYRRFSQVLDVLLRAGVLPMRDSGIDILDVGAGPGPALFASSDFYEQLAEYAKKHSIAGLATPQPKLHAAEASARMGHVMHWISELSNRRGPHQRRLGSFHGTDFDQLRIEERDATVLALREDDPWITISDLFAWQDEWRFNFGIFSYFLTNERFVDETTRELQSLFASMRAGGVVVVLGAVAGRYRKVYKAVDKVAKREVMRRIEQRHSRIVCDHADRYLFRIKEVYSKIWERLEAEATGLDALKRELPKDLWDPNVPIKRMREFGLRVFRRIDIAPQRASWHKKKKKIASRRAGYRAAGRSTTVKSTVT